MAWYFNKQLLNRLAKILLYLFTPFLVFKCDQFLYANISPALIAVYNILSLVLLISVFLTMKLTRRANGFKSSTLDFLVIFVIILIPNLLFIGTIFFALATLTRKMILTYISGVLFLLIYAMAMGGFANLDNDTFRILADPFGVSAISLLSKFWTVSEINNNSMHLFLLIQKWV